MNREWTTTQKRQVKIFMLVAFGMPVVMGIVMGITFYRGFDVTIFPTAQMMYPAAGVMLAAILTKSKESKLPMKFIVTYLTATVLILLLTCGSMFVSSTMWNMVAQYVLILGSIIAWIMLLCEKRTVKEAWNLRFGGHKKSMLFVLLFFVLYIVRFVLCTLAEGQGAGLLPFVTDVNTWTLFLVVIINFFMSYLAFFGEEFGWRYFFQPLLQKKFGLRAGVILLGVLWGLWHLPINMFFYSPQTWLQSVLIQQITCITLAVLWGFMYMKTKNIWVPIMAHYINNNMILVFTQTADISNAVYSLWNVLEVLVINGVLFLPFIFSKVYKKENAEQIQFPFEEKNQEVL